MSSAGTVSLHFENQGWREGQNDIRVFGWEGTSFALTVSRTSGTIGSFGTRIWDSFILILPRVLVTHSGAFIDVCICLPCFLLCFSFQAAVGIHLTSPLKRVPRPPSRRSPSREAHEVGGPGDRRAAGTVGSEESRHNQIYFPRKPQTVEGVCVDLFVRRIFLLVHKS